MASLRDEVFAICDRLTAQGQKITVRIVRSERGGGDQTGISHAINAWKELNVDGSVAELSTPERIRLQFREVSERQRKLREAHDELGASINELKRDIERYFNEEGIEESAEDPAEEV